MARRRFKLTVFTRFLILLVIVAPLAYIGASYYNGEDGVENVKNLIRKVTSEKTEQVEEKEESSRDVSKKETSNILVNSELTKLRDELASKIERIDSLYLENATLKAEVESKVAELKAKDAELKEVEEQLKKIKSAISN